MTLGRTIAAVASAAAAFAVAVAALAASSGSFLHVGDVVTYGLAIGVDVKVEPAPHTTQPPITMKTSVSGSETISALRADPDGSIHAKVDVALNSAGTSGTTIVNRTLLMKVSPDGSVSGEGGEDATTMQYMRAVSDAAAPFKNRSLYVGEKFSQTVTLPGIVPMTVTTIGTVIGMKSYLGYPTYAIQSTGSGNFDTTIEGQPAKGTFEVAGTTYYDQRDKLLIGEAMRSTMNAQLSGSLNNRINAVSTVTLQLGSFVHGKPKPAAVPHAVKAAPSPTPVPSPSPSSTPTLSPSQYYTPTPPAPTPAPSYMPYPPR
jgi:hypothetical protein